MKEISRRVFTRQVEEVNDLHYVCNKCGIRRRKMLSDARGKQYAETAPGIPLELDEEDTEASAFLHVSHTGGWGDRAFGDGTKIEFELCQDCLLELVKSFKVPAEAKNTMWLGPYVGNVEVGEPHSFIDANETFGEAKDLVADWDTRDDEEDQ